VEQLSSNENTKNGSKVSNEKMTLLWPTSKSHYHRTIGIIRDGIQNNILLLLLPLNELSSSSLLPLNDLPLSSLLPLNEIEQGVCFFTVTTTRQQQQWRGRGRGRDEMARWWIRRETQTIICIVCLYVPTVLNDSMIQEDYVGMNEWAVLCCDNSSARERKRRRSNSSASYLFSNHVRSISNSFFINI